MSKDEDEREELYRAVRAELDELKKVLAQNGAMDPNGGPVLQSIFNLLKDRDEARWSQRQSIELLVAAKAFDSSLPESIEKLLKELRTLRDGGAAQQRRPYQAGEDFKRHEQVMTGAIVLLDGTRICLRHVESYTATEPYRIHFYGSNGRSLGVLETPPSVMREGKQHFLTTEERVKHRDGMLEQIDHLFNALD